MLAVAIALLIPMGVLAVNGAQHLAVVPAAVPAESASQAGGFVYETLLLNNQTVFHGNYIRDFSGSGAYSIQYGQFNNNIFVSYSNSYNISVYNGSTLKLAVNISVPFNSSEFFPDNQINSLMIYSYHSNVVYLLNASNEIEGNFTVASPPVNVAENFQDGIIYLLSEYGTVELVNSSTYDEIKQINLSASSMVYDPENGDVYLLNLNGTSTNMIVISGSEIVKSVNLNRIGIYMAFDQQQNVLLVQMGNSIQEYNASTLELYNSISVFNYEPIFGIFYCQGNNYVYAISEDLSQVSAYSISGSFITTITTGVAPSIGQEGMAYDDALKAVLVVNTQSDSLSVIPLNIYSVTFKENDLETGSKWSVTFNGETVESTNSSISFIADNGSYQYSVLFPSDYTTTSSRGTVDVNGNDPVVQVGFTSPFTLYNVRVYSAGLPAGVEWKVTIGNSTHVEYNMANNEGDVYEFMTFSLPAGTYNYTISSPGYHSVPPYPINWTYSIYSYDPYQPYISSLSDLSSSGTINITSSASFISYFRITTYMMTFLETGLPVGTFWYVSATDFYHFGYSNSITFYLPNGTYDVSTGTSGSDSTPLLPFNGSNGYKTSASSFHLTVDSEARKMNVTFTRNQSYVYANFSFLRYPTGYPDIVSIGNLTEYSVLTQNVSFLIPKGNYSAKILSTTQSITIPIVFDFYESGNYVTRNFSAENNVHINLTFEPPYGYYPVTFTSLQLPHNSTFFILIAQNSSLVNYLFSHNGTILAYLKNGSYSIVTSSLIYSNFSYQLSFSTIQVENGYEILQPNLQFNYFPLQNYETYEGNFTVNGTEQAVHLNFEREYQITFNITGLLNGERAEIKIVNKTFNSSGGEVSVNEINGSYGYNISILNETGQIELVNGSGNVVVDGQNASVSVRIIHLGYLAGNISPNYATILVGGKAYKTVNGSFNISLIPGVYEVKVSAPGFSTYITTVKISSSVSTELPIQKLSKPSSLYVFLELIIVVAVALIVAFVAWYFIARNSSRKKS